MYCLQRRAGILTVEKFCVCKKRALVCSLAHLFGLPSKFTTSAKKKTGSFHMNLNYSKFFHIFSRSHCSESAFVHLQLYTCMRTTHFIESEKESVYERERYVGGKFAFLHAYLFKCLPLEIKKIYIRVTNICIFILNSTALWSHCYHVVHFLMPHCIFAYRCIRMHSLWLSFPWFLFSMPRKKTIIPIIKENKFYFCKLTVP